VNSHLATRSNSRMFAFLLRHRNALWWAATLLVLVVSAIAVVDWASGNYAESGCG
jgi:hypothetical protein